MDAGAEPVKTRHLVSGWRDGYLIGDDHEAATVSSALSGNNKHPRRRPLCAVGHAGAGLKQNEPPSAKVKQQAE